MHSRPSLTWLLRSVAALTTVCALAIPPTLAAQDAAPAPGRIVGQVLSDQGTASSGSATPQVVDNVRPREVEVAEFRAGLDSVAALEGGAESRDALVLAFVRALERADTAALVGLTMSRAEFAYLYYPTTPQAQPPYDLSPKLMWFMMSSRSEKGVRHALDERAGMSLGYLDYRCLGEPSLEGENSVWGPCVIRRLQAPGDTIEERLFGPILRRGGRFKFVSLANQLD